MRHIRKGTLTAGAVASALLIAACGSSSDNSSGGSGGSSSQSGGDISSVPVADLGGQSNADRLTSLYRQAVDAGQTKIVLAGAAAPTETRLFDAFTKEFPKIKVDPVSASGPQLETSVNAEFSSGKHTTDLAETTILLLLGFEQQHQLIDNAVFTAQGVDPSWIGPNRSFYAGSLAPLGLAYNTTQVKPADVPRTWNALLDSRWKSRISMADPSVVGPMAQVFAGMLNSGKYTSDFISRLHANQPKVAAPTNPSGTTDAVSQGAAALGIPASQKFTEQAHDRGAPIQFTLMDDDNFVTPNAIALLRGAPNAIAARLYMNWLLTPQGGRAVAQDINAYSPVPGTPPPPGLPELRDIHLLPQIPVDQQVARENAAIATAKGIFGS